MESQKNELPEFNNVKVRAIINIIKFKIVALFSDRLNMTNKQSMANYEFLVQKRDDHFLYNHS
jgi:hypothetical protein